MYINVVFCGVSKEKKKNSRKEKKVYHKCHYNRPIPDQISPSLGSSHCRARPERRTLLIPPIVSSTSPMTTVRSLVVSVAIIVVTIPSVAVLAISPAFLLAVSVRVAASSTGLVLGIVEIPAGFLSSVMEGVAMLVVVVTVRLFAPGAFGVLAPSIPA